MSIVIEKQTDGEMSQKNINYVRIIGKNNGVGLKQDAEILISLIEDMGMNAIYERPLKGQKENMPYIKYRLLRILNKNMFLPILSLFCKNSAQTMNIFLDISSILPPDYFRYNAPKNRVD